MNDGRTPLALAGAGAVALTTFTLGSTFADSSYVVPALLAVGTVVGAAQAARRWGAPAALVPLVSLGALALLLTLFFAPAGALLGLIPTATTLEAVRLLVADAGTDVRDQVAPVVASDGLLMLTAAGVGAVAVLVDILAAQLRRPALAGLPLLVLVAVPAATTRSGLGTVPFLLAAAGYLLLLLVEGRGRVTRWGRTLEGGGGRGRVPSPGVATGRRLSVAALGLAVALPALIPGLQSGFRLGSGGNGDGPGSTVVQTYNPIVTLRGQLLEPEPVEILRVRTTDPTPGYLRMTSLDRFDGATWFSSDLRGSRRDRVSEGLPAIVGLRPDVVVRDVVTDIAASTLGTSWLPVPYPVVAVDVPGDWRFDQRAQVIWSPQVTTERLAWQTRSTVPEPQAGQLRVGGRLPSEVDPFLELPASLPPQIGSLVTGILGQADNPYDRAVALQAFFRDGSFRYSLDVPQGNSDNDLLNFLDVRAGYCEQFAATMAVMARVAGIPARVAIGFTAGTPAGPGEYSVTTRDAHAWPELYFAGIGWLPFEPTPTGDGRAVPPTYSLVPGAADPGAAPAPADPAVPAPTAATPPPGGSPGAKNPGQENPGAQAAPVRDVLVLGGRVLSSALVVLALLSVPLLLRTLLARRRRRTVLRGGRPAAHAAWAELLDSADDHGVHVPAGVSPRQSAAYLLAEAPWQSVDLAAVRPALAVLVQAQEQALYRSEERVLVGAGGGAAARSPDRAEVADLLGEVAVVRAALSAGAGRGVRVRARLFPPSALSLGARRAGESVADALDSVDAAPGRALGRLRRR